MILCSEITFDLSKIDELAIIITVVGYVVVFIALAALVFVIGRIAGIQTFVIGLKNRSKRQTKPVETELSAPTLSADENAAICTALYLYFTELHDEERYVMTVKKVSRSYSPWSSKIYGIMDFNKRG